MYGTDHLKKIHLLFWDVKGLPDDVKREIVVTLSEIYTVTDVGFGSIPGEPILSWIGKYTNGEIDKTQTLLRIDGEFGSRLLEIRNTFTSIITSMCDNTSISISTRNEIFVRMYGELLVGEANKRAIIRELVLVWEICRNKGFLYKNRVLCMG
jgi:hypothetical protein